MTDKWKQSANFWYAQAQGQRAKRASEVKVWRFIALGLVLAVLAACLLGVLLSDLAWCHENYQVDRIPHCLWSEGSVFGRFVQP